MAGQRPDTCVQSGCRVRKAANKDSDKGWVFLRHPSIFTLDMVGVLLYLQPCMGLRRKERSNLGKAKTKASGGQPLPL